ncbi:hypothetical protein DBA29_17300 [Xenophilus aerolatus]|nr:hypothetical protein [Xenophilus aerolatus]
MAKNLYRAFLNLLPPRDLQIAEVIAVDGDLATLQLVGGGVVTARGAATPGQKVFVRDGLIEAQAPDLPIVTVEV